LNFSDDKNRGLSQLVQIEHHRPNKRELNSQKRSENPESEDQMYFLYILKYFWLGTYSKSQSVWWTVATCKESSWRDWHIESSTPVLAEQRHEEIVWKHWRMELWNNGDNGFHGGDGMVQWRCTSKSSYKSIA